MCWLKKNNRETAGSPDTSPSVKKSRGDDDLSKHRRQRSTNSETDSDGKPKRLSARMTLLQQAQETVQAAKQAMEQAKADEKKNWKRKCMTRVINITKKLLVKVAK